MVNPQKPILYALLALAIVWALASLSFPFGWDQGIFAWVGNTVVDGGLPYRDAWDIKGPLTYYVYGTAQLFFGKNAFAIRLTDLIFLSLAAFYIARLAAKLSGPKTGPWAAVIFVLWYASQGFWHTAQPDGWASMLALFAIGPLLTNRDDPRSYRYLLSGFAIGLAVLIKPIYGLFAIALAIDAVFRYRKDVLRLFAAGTSMMLGVIVPFAIAVAWFAYNGALQVFVDTWLVYPVQVYSPAASPKAFSRAVGLIRFAESGMLVSVAWPVIVVGAVSRRHECSRTFSVLLAWVFIAVFCVVLQGRFFEYHWAIIIPSMVLLGTKGFTALFETIRNERRESSSHGRGLIRPMVLTFLVLVIGLAAVRPALDAARWTAHIVGLVDTPSYYSAFASAEDARLAAKYIREHTAPGEKISVWGWDASIIFESDRNAVSRFGYSMPLIMGKGTLQQKQLREEFLSAVHSDPPAYVVVSPQSEMILGESVDITDFPEFSDFIAQNYTEEARFGKTLLYRRLAR